MSPEAMTELTISSSSQLLSIPKLRDDGSNWADYEPKTRTAMGSRGLIRHVDGTAVAPRPYTIVNGIQMVDTTTEATEDQIEAKEKKLDEFEQKLHLARHILQNSISLRLSSIIKNMTLPKDMWDAIRKDATSKSQLQIVDTRRKLLEMRCEETGDVKAHLNQMLELRDQLAGMGMTLSADELGIIILGSTPPSYRTFLSSVTTAVTAAGRTLDPDNLVRMIVSEAEHRAIDERGDKAAESALMAGRAKKGNSKNKGKGTASTSGSKCDNCGRTGHTTPECYQEGGGKAGQWPASWKNHPKPKKGCKANIATSAKPDEDDMYAFTCVNAIGRTPGRPEFDIVLDSGATDHFCSDRAKFLNYTQISPKPINAADGRTFDAIGRGDIPIIISNGDTSTKITLKDAIHAPQIAATLVSVARLDKAKYSANFANGTSTVKSPSGKTIGVFPFREGLYQASVKPVPDDTMRANLATTKVSLAQAHRILGHVSYGSVKHAISSGKVTGIQINDDTAESFCEACAQAKPHRKPFPKAAQHRAMEYGERIHSDLWGPASVTSIGGHRYSIDFTDDATRWTVTDVLKTKDQAQGAYERFEKRLETQNNAKIKILRTDRGRELYNKDFDKHLFSKGTIRELTVHDTHEQVGVAERLNRTKLELARAMLIDSGLPRFLWVEAIHHAIWIKNRAPTRALANQITPYEAKYKTKPSFEGVPPFGTPAWTMIVDAGKLDWRARPGYFVGFDDESKAYRIYQPEKRKVTVEREVVFDTDLRLNLPEVPEIVQAEGKMPTVTQNDQPATPQPKDTPTIPNVETTTVLVPANPPDPELPIPRRSTRFAPHEPGHYKAINQGKKTALSAAPYYPSLHPNPGEEPMLAFLSGLGTEPRSLSEALRGPNAAEWDRAWNDELAVLNKLHTWKLVPRPPNKPVIPCRAILKEKKGPDGQIIKRKVRLVAGGHKQTKGIDYDETFAVAAKVPSIRVVLAYAAQRDWEIHHIDIIAAYLNADIDCEVYMEAPQGVLKEGEEQLVCLILKGLYGLKQSGRTWQKKLTATFTELGFTRSDVDHSVFVRKLGDNTLIIPVSTDDMVIAGTTPAAVADFKVEIQRYFDITDLGEIKWLLGFEIRRNRRDRSIGINQAAYLQSMAARFGLSESKPTYTPMDPGIILNNPEEPEEKIDVPYQEACGHILWPAIISRPDVQFAIGSLAQYTHSHATIHWNAIKRVIRYLYTTRNLWLIFAGEVDDLHGYTDA